MDFEKLASFLNSNRETQVTCDSRELKSGGIFVAIKGTRFDGHDHIQKVLNLGANYVVAENKTIPDDKIVVVNNSRDAYAKLAQIKYGNPASSLKALAVTGTNGKTTTCYIVRSIINQANQKCGLIGTVEYDIGDEKKTIPADMTTPDAMRLAQMTSAMKKNGCNFLAIEASSHALTQDRLSCFDFIAAAFTNLTGDHLDYHKTMDNYLNAKSLLFESLKPTSWAILNGEIKESKKIAAKTKARVLYYGIGKDFDINAQIISSDTQATRYKLSFNNKSVEINTPLLGRYNISNQLAAAGICLRGGFSLESIKKGIEAIKNVPGRLERVDTDKDFCVVVDYAHTDDALANVLKTLRNLCKSRLVVLFGCGGNRDKSKRARMARVAQNYADNIFLTSDNPRNESPLEIIEDVKKGFSDNLTNVVIEPDRKKAIELAINFIEKDDILLLAGKGHEDYQIIGETKYPFDDRVIAKDCLEKK